MAMEGGKSAYLVRGSKAYRRTWVGSVQMRHHFKQGMWASMNSGIWSQDAKGQSYSKGGLPPPCIFSNKTQKTKMATASQAFSWHNKFQGQCHYHHPRKERHSLVGQHVLPFFQESWRHHHHNVGVGTCAGQRRIKFKGALGGHLRTVKLHTKTRTKAHTSRDSPHPWKANELPGSRLKSADLTFSKYA